jgi:hypothetical protein
MGSIKQGILGGFSGKVGTVVGSTWKSTHYMRALAVSTNDAKTEKQLCQRHKFSMAVDFLRSITPFVRIGYQSYAKDQSAFNAAMSYLLKNAINGCGANTSIDYNKALVARGNLTTAMDATATVEGNKVSYAWVDNSGTGDAKTTDNAMLLAYNKNKKEAVYTTNSATRSEAKAELALPANWSDDALAIYLSFCSTDSRSVANSICLKNDAFSGGSGEDNPGGGSGSGGSDGDLDENPMG